MAYVGGTPSWNGKRVDSLSAAVTLDRDDSGKVFMVTDSGESGYTVTLPTPANAGIGWSAKFINNCTASGTLNGSGGEDVVFNDGQTDVMVTFYTDHDSDVTDDDATDTVGFDNISVKGDWIELFSDGTTWFAYGQSGVDGGILVAT